MSFAAPIEIAGMVVQGLCLEGNCEQDFPDRHVCFELVVQKTPTRRRVVLERLEWLSLKGGHSNKRRRPVGVPRRTDASHWHKFELNYQPSSRRMGNDNLSVAINFEETFSTYENFRIFVGERLKISNVELVTRPEWEYSLFYEPGPAAPDFLEWGSDP